jgi:DNA modification methylase
MLEGFRFLGIELDPEYCEIARARVASATPPLFGGVNGAGQ